MDLDSLMNYLKNISTEEKSIIVPNNEMDKALNGQIIPSLNNYSSLTVEMLKLSTDDKKYYKEFYNRLIEKHDANITFRTTDSLGNKDDYEFNKFKIIDALDWAKDNNKLTSEEIEKFKLLKMSVEFSKFIDKYSKEYASSIIEGNFVTLPVKSFIDLMTAKPKNLDSIIKEGKYNNKDLDIIVYALDDFLDKAHILDRYYIPKKVSVNLSALKENVDITYINRCLDYEYTYLNKVKINEDLKKEIIKDLPSDFDDLEKAFYIYYKMCTILSYDEEYFAKRDRKADNIHKDFQRLLNITKENNKVICYEFNAIYARLLRDLGIKYELNGSTNYGDGHASLTFRVDKLLIRADSTVGMIKSDLGYAKNGLMLTGFTLENDNKSTREIFDEKLEKVYDYIRRNNKVSKDFEGTVRELSVFEQALPTDLSLEEKVAIFIAMSKDSTLNVMDRIPYEIKLSKILFKKDNIGKEKFKINYISYEEDAEKEKYTTAKILTYNNNGVDNIKNNKYIFIDPDNNMHKISLNAIKQALALGLYRGLLDDHHTIPGVELAEMNGYVKSIKKTTKVVKRKKCYKSSKLKIALNTLDKLTKYNSSELGQAKTHK